MIAIVMTMVTTVRGQTIYSWWTANEAAFSDNADEDGFHEIAGATCFHIFLILDDVSPLFPDSYSLYCLYEDCNGVRQDVFNAFVSDKPSTNSDGTETLYEGFTLDERGRVNQEVVFLIDDDEGCIYYREEKTHYEAIFCGCKALK